MALALAIACTPTEPPLREQAAPVAIEVPAVEPVAEALAPAPVVPPPPRVVPTLDLPMHVVVRVDGYAYVHQLVDERLVVQGDAEIVLVPPTGPVARDPSLVRGLVLQRPSEDDGDDGEGEEATSELLDLQGTWPDAAFIGVTTDEGGRVDSSQLDYYRWNDGWEPIQNVEDGLFAWSYQTLAPWRDGSLLGLRAYEEVSNYDPDEDGEAEDLDPPSVSGFDVIGPTAHAAPRFGSDGIVDFDSVASGHALALQYGDVVLWWTPGRTRAKELSLPKALPLRVYPRGVDLIDAKSGYVWGEYMDPARVEIPYVARFDGKDFHPIEIPCCGGVDRWLVDRDGVAWWLARPSRTSEPSKRTLWRRGADGVATRVRVLEAGKAEELAVSSIFVSQGAVWMSASVRGDTLLLHGEPREPVLELHSTESLDDFAAFDPKLPCAAVYVPLDSDRVATEAQVQELRSGLTTVLDLVGRGTIDLVETRYLDRRGHGLMVRGAAETLPGAVATMDVMTVGLGEPVCGEPEILRVVTSLGTAAATP